MTDQQQPQGQPYADATPTDDPSVNRQEPADETAEAPATPADQGTQPAAAPAAQSEPAGETDDTAEAVEPGETTSVPTTRGPGPDDGEDQGGQG